MTFFLYFTYALFIIVALLLMLLILIQKGRGGGLAGAFGGGGGGTTAFGSKTGDVLTWATSILFGVFLVLAIALNLLANNYSAQRTATAAPAVTTPVPSTPASPAAPGPTTPAQSTPVAPAAPAEAPKPAPTTK